MTPAPRYFQVLDGVFGGEWCLAARGEIEGLRRAGRLHANATHIVRAGERQLLPKAGILEAELLDPARSSNPNPRQQGLALERDGCPAHQDTSNFATCSPKCGGPETRHVKHGCGGLLLTSRV